MPATYCRIALSKDQELKFDERLKMVRYADEHGAKPAAMAFGCQPRIVRKWLRRWREDNHSRASLMDRSRAPKTCPHKTPPHIEQRVLRERDKAPCLGARRLKEFCDLPASEGAIARILRQNGRTQPRKKKYQKKRDMRAVKARLKAFEQLQIDTKYLNDIPYYIEQMLRHGNLPRFQYTARDVKTGATFLGFASELSQAHACCFIAAVLAHLRRCRQRPVLVQTDNGSEYSGLERATKNDRGFSHVVRDLFGLTHRFIPPGMKNHQADVETLHERIEAEFLDLEGFASRPHFFDKASAWQLWWNTTRKNGYKGRRTPDQILLEEQPAAGPEVWLLPALDLDHLLEQRAQPALKDETGPRGYYVPALPASEGGVGSRYWMTTPSDLAGGTRPCRVRSHSEVMPLELLGTKKMRSPVRRRIGGSNVKCWVPKPGVARNRKFLFSAAAVAIWTPPGSATPVPKMPLASVIEVTSICAATTTVYRPLLLLL
ncbi:MAG: hypothetical protein KF858_07680 [Candidatus Sumerlaeia bacterium]|nr:hypothetical protein [Candidatus Sumerlaeia bacterium]